MSTVAARRISSFGFAPGSVLAGKYEVVSLLGAGWEGEVYKLRERGTGIVRAGKFFFPQRNRKNRTMKFYARKLHKLRHCPILVQYHTQETITLQGIPVTFLVSEYVEGGLLSQFLERQPRKRLNVFQALHLLYTLATGVEPIHECHEYHGDLHSDNILIRRRGISYEVKLIDMYHCGWPISQGIGSDVCDLIRIFYDALGGQRHYARQPREVKAICCGLKRSLIVQKYRTAGQLCRYLETMEWFDE